MEERGRRAPQTAPGGPGGPSPNTTRGPRALVLRRQENQDFGFTLRHFIVYPPESYTILGGDRRLQNVSVDEPMDTIFVRLVREGSPAHLAGLAQGDRIVSVNGETIGGKSYAQVVQLIQNSGAYLYLLVVPKEEDLLQQYFGETAHNPETNQRPQSQTQRMRSPEVRDRQASPYRPPTRPVSTSSSDCPSPSVWSPGSGHGPGAGHGPGLHFPAETETPRRASEGCTQRRELTASARTQFMMGAPVVAASLPTQCRLSLDAGQAGQVGLLDGRRESSSSLPTATSSKDSLLSMDSSSTLQDGCSSDDSVILSRIRKSTEQKEEFLRRPAQPIWPTGDAAGTGPPKPRKEGAIAREFYARPQKLQRPVWPPPPQSEPLAEPHGEAQRDSEAAGAGRGDPNTSQPQPHFIPGGPVGAASVQARSNKSYFSTLSRIQENQTSVSSTGSEDTMMNGDSLPSSCSSRGAEDGHPLLPVIHLVSRRARQFEAGEEEDATDRTSFYRSELARLSAKKGVPEVAVRKREFESRSLQENSNARKLERGSPSLPGCLPSGSASGNRSIPVGSTKLHCDPPPDYKPAPEDLSYGTDLRTQPSTLQMRIRSHSADPTPHDQRQKTGRHDAISSERKRQAVTSAVLDEELESIEIAPSPAPKIPASDPISSPVRPNQLTIPNLIRPGIHPQRNSIGDPSSLVQALKGSTLTSDLSSVIKRPKDASAADEDRSTRRISYLKATWNDRMHVDSDLELSDTEPPLNVTHRSPAPAPAANKENVQLLREGWLHCKITSIDGKRAGDRSWKQVWAVVRGPLLCLYKDRAHSQQPETPLGSAEGDHPGSAGSATGSSVDLRCSLVEVATDYTKKKHVLRLNAASGSELLLQADTGADLLQWVQVLQEQAGQQPQQQGEPQGLSPTVAHKGIKKLTSLRNRSPTGQSPLNKTRKPSQAPESLPSPKSKTWKGRVAKQFRRMHQGGSHSPSSPTAPHPEGVTIGVPLEDCPPSTFSEAVPLLLELCTSIVEARGLEVIGIYRVPGNTAAVTTLTESINKGFEFVNLQDPRWGDVNVISSLLKSFFRRLPDSLFTTELYPSFIEADKIDKPIKRAHAIRKLIRELPEHHYETLKYLMIHLKRVVDHSHTNKMEARNLAIVFGPTLVRAGDDNMVTMVTDMSSQCRIVETLISNVDWFFSEDDSDEFPLRLTEEANTSITAPNLDVVGAVSNVPSPNQSLLLGNIHKVEGLKVESPSKDVSAKDIVSSIITAANRKIQRGKSKKVEIEISDSKTAVEEQRPKIKDNSTYESVSDADSPPAGAPFIHTSMSSNDSMPSVGGGKSSNLLPIASSPPSSNTTTFTTSFKSSGFSSLRYSSPPSDDVAIMSYANLAQTTQERIRRFELETKAMLERDLHRQTRDSQQWDEQRRRIEKQWLEAKQELEADDPLDGIVDNLADKSVSSGEKLSTSCSGDGTPPQRGSWRAGWGARLSSVSNSASSLLGAPSPAAVPAAPSPADAHSNGHLKRMKTGKEPRTGSLDSLQGAPPSERPRSHMSDEGGDLLASLTSTFDQKLKSLLGTSKATGTTSSSTVSKASTASTSSTSTTTTTTSTKTVTTAVESTPERLHLLNCNDDIPFADTDTADLDLRAPQPISSLSSSLSSMGSTSPALPSSYRDPSLHRASRILRSSTVPANPAPIESKGTSVSKYTSLRWSSPVNTADCTFASGTERTNSGNIAESVSSVLNSVSTVVTASSTSVSVSNNVLINTTVSAPLSVSTSVQCEKPKRSELLKSSDCFQSSTKLKRSESLNKSSDRSDTLSNSKLRRSESLNKNDRAEMNLNVKLRRSESLNKPDKADSKLKRSDSLTKTEKTESNMNRRRQQENRTNVRGNSGGSTINRDKETTKMLIQNATIVLTKLKRKNGMPERSIKRRHTVGGTKDFDKLHWLDNRLQSEQWENDTISYGIKEKKSLRTSSPDLSSSRLAGILVEVSLLHTGDAHRPHSLPDPNLVSAVFKVPLESHV